jgi:hypothetical protein
MQELLQMQLLIRIQAFHYCFHEEGKSRLCTLREQQPLQDASNYEDQRVILTRLTKRQRVIKFAWAVSEATRISQYKTA